MSAPTGSGTTAPSTPAPSGDQAAPTGGQTPSANSGGVTVEALGALLAQHLAPLNEKIKTLENAQAAARRVAGRSGGSGNDDAAGAGGNKDPNLSELEQLRERDRQRDLEIQVLKDAERKRQDADRQSAIDKALETAIVGGKFANSDLLRDLIAPKPREFVLGQSNDVFVKEGDKMTKLGDFVTRFAARDIFQPSAPGSGTKATAASDSTQPAGVATALTAEDITKMTPEERAKLRAKIKAGALT